MPFAPRWTLNAGAEYRVQTSIGTFTPRLQWAYLASQWSATFQNSSSFVPSRSIVDARLTYEPAEQWRVEAAVTNLFDETYVASQLFNTSSADGGSLYGAPRQYSVRVIYRFN
jgi:iron complex outermembrane receptor protein